jgi:hypothetical protein
MKIYLVSADDTASLENILEYAKLHEKNTSEPVANPANCLTVLIYKDTRTADTKKTLPSQQYAKNFYQIKSELCGLKHTQTFLIQHNRIGCTLYDEKDNPYSPIKSGIYIDSDSDTLSSKSDNHSLDFMGTKPITVLNSSGNLNDFFLEIATPIDKESTTPESTLYKLNAQMKVSYITPRERYIERIRTVTLRFNAPIKLTRSYAGIPVTKEEQTLLRQAIKRIKETNFPYDLLLKFCSQKENRLRCRDRLIHLATAISHTSDPFIIAERQAILLNAIEYQLTPRQWQIVWESYSILKSEAQDNEPLIEPSAQIRIYNAIETFEIENKKNLIRVAEELIEQHIEKIHTHASDKTQKKVTLHQPSIIRFFNDNTLYEKLEIRDINTLFNSDSTRGSIIEKYLEQYRDKKINTRTRMKALLNLAAYYRNATNQTERSYSPDNVADIEARGQKKPRSK